jgi:hypothetical protein
MTPRSMLSMMAATLALTTSPAWAQSGATGSGTPQVPMSNGAGGTLTTNPPNVITNGNPNTSTLPQKQVGVQSSAAAARAARRNASAPDTGARIDNSAAAREASRPVPSAPQPAGINSPSSPGNPMNKLGEGATAPSTSTGAAPMTGGSVDTNGRVQSNGPARP